MASSPSGNGSDKPRLHQTRSFTRMETSDMNPFARTRAKTVQSMATPEIVSPDAHPISLVDEEENTGPDVFEKRDSSDSGVGDDGQQGDEVSMLSRGVQDQPEELPIELASLTDRFVNSLSAKTHSSPPTIDKISMLFQDFYVRAESHIATHISALASRINRDPSPQPLPKLRGSTNNKGTQDGTEKAISGRQMLTASEVAEKRKARKFLAYKRVALEEAVERKACEGIYDKIWRHKATLDEVRDEKLRSKTAAFMLVGINLKDLGIDLDHNAIDEQKQKEADDCLSVARECLAKMNDEKYPLGKLQHLAAAHKAIVDALTKLLPSTSSADEILPTLIYSLITCPPEGINIISNLLFIQRFRSSSKMDGETAYCLTNLEAAICFLENVDLSSLRGEESQDGQTKSASNTSTPSTEHNDPFPPTKEAAQASLTTVSASSEILKPNGNETASDSLSRPQQPASLQQRRLNNLFQPPSKVLGAANDAVRNTADQGLKNIGASLDSSLNFFFGRLKELQGPGGEGGSPVLPKTLAEARRLVTSPSTSDNKSLDAEDNATKEPTLLERPLMRHATSRAEDLFAGRRSRDRSADSVRTQGSSKKSIAGSSLFKDGSSPGHSQASPSIPPSSTPTPLESVRNFGNTLNPLNHIPGMIKSFGRNAPDTPAPGGPVSSPAASERLKTSPAPAERPPSTSSSSPKIDPPIQRFLETKHANDLTIGDIATLLEDYKRLATTLFKPGVGSN